MRKAPFALGSTGLLAVFATAGACTTYGDEVIPPPFSTGLPEEEPLSSLEPEQVRQLCDAAEDFTVKQHEKPLVRHGFCFMEAVPSLAALQASGVDEESLRAECLNMVLECLESGVEVPPTECPERMECEVTVAELERCIDDTYRKIRDLPHCDDITIDDEFWEMARVPDSCDRILEECPDEL
jgi:hypothetical protein